MKTTRNVVINQSRSHTLCIVGSNTVFKDYPTTREDLSSYLNIKFSTKPTIHIKDCRDEMFEVQVTPAECYKKVKPLSDFQDLVESFSIL